ncbi:class I tRNA ligase family protein [Curtobacterium sp. ISL-83]|uniref:class I tRNA ligase family protein n=1 Tax=Curtobacterium sp. ISL-83 TaxID=2819145 RepID=UPI001BE5E9AE|nr:class I tRNA ligase family protein [Curtobacterium sp. ISL-83]MBT2504249.1 class I tRNA ligase family protein [Curtobacterium sp. ISL-83]
MRDLLDETVRLMPTASKYLFFPGYFTPNGELHLGHVAGPYLRAEIARRTLELFGAHVTTVSASDAFESGVTYAAVTGGGSAEAIASQYAERARTALADLGFAVDLFADPTRSPWREREWDAAVAVIDALERAGRIDLRDEELLVGEPPAPAAGVGAFVEGTCPSCRSAQSGNVCELCGRWLDPAAMNSIWPHDGTQSRARSRSAFVRTDSALTPDGVRGVVEADYQYLVADHLHDAGETLRVSYPSWWGLQWPGDTLPGHVISSYVLGKYGATRMLGDAVAEELGSDPFAVDGDVVTAAFGGLDSAFGWLALHGLTGDGVSFRPFDHVVVNRFLLLDGEKFSTSRRHAIRVHDALDAGVDVNALRLLLSRVAPASTETNLDVTTATWQSDDDVSAIDGALLRTVGAAAGGDVAEEIDPDASRRAREAFAALRRAVVLPEVDALTVAATFIDWARWVSDGGAPHAPRFARRVLALLAYPLMPAWAKAVENSTGGGLLPDVAASSDLHIAPVPRNALETLQERVR